MEQNSKERGEEFIQTEVRSRNIDSWIDFQTHPIHHSLLSSDLKYEI